MKRTGARIIFVPLLIAIGCQSTHAERREPRLAVIFVIDQCAYHYIPKLARYMRGGIRFLFENGIVYESAYVPHAVPSTGPGHAGLNTGVLPKDHGIVANRLFLADGKQVACDTAPVKTSAVINPRGGVYDYGKGPDYLMVDGISDQMVLSSQPCRKRKSISFSYKARAAIMTAGHAGKAIWFDDASGQFTSSKAYYDKLPQWLVTFNQHTGLDQPYTWHLAVEARKSQLNAYCFKHIKNYTYTKTGQSLIGPVINKTSGSEPYSRLLKTPRANQVLLNLAQDCIRTHMTRYGNEQLLLWVCISSLDKLGHEYGPDSLEAIDMLYHLDQQIGAFMNCITTWVPKRDILYVLTADHGISSIPELAAQDGYEPALRINPDTLIKTINENIEKSFGVKQAISSYHSQHFHLNEKELAQISKEKKPFIIESIRHQLVSTPYIKKVWTPQELEQSWYQLPDIEAYFKNQLYLGRNGPFWPASEPHSFIIQPLPYVMINENSFGTNHAGPYENNTHVPLVLYQRGEIGKLIIDKKVWTLQLANTLAYLLETPKPSSSIFEVLPGIIDEQFRDEWYPV